MKLWFFFLALPLSLAASANDPVVPIHETNIQMNAAIARAQREVDGFLAERSNPRTTARDFKVKVKVTSGTQVEYMWVTPFRTKQSGFEGILKNHPGLVRNLRWGDTVEFTREQIADWAYIKDGVQYGHYTTCVVLSTQGREFAAKEAKSMGLRCEP